MFLTIEISRDDVLYNARCVELDVSAEGTTSDKAMAKLKKIISFYISTAKEDEIPEATESQADIQSFN